MYLLCVCDSQTCNSTECLERGLMAECALNVCVQIKLKLMQTRLLSQKQLLLKRMYFSTWLTPYTKLYFKSIRT